MYLGIYNYINTIKKFWKTPPRLPYTFTPLQAPSLTPRQKQLAFSNSFYFILFCTFSFFSMCGQRNAVVAESQTVRHPSGRAALLKYFWRPLWLKSSTLSFSFFLLLIFFFIVLRSSRDLLLKKGNALIVWGKTKHDWVCVGWWSKEYIFLGRIMNIFGMKSEELRLLSNWDQK